MCKIVNNEQTVLVISGRWEMLLELTLTCVLECTLGMFSVVWLASRNGSMMFGHMTLPWPITWRRGVYLGKISIWLLFFPISWFSHICHKYYYAHGEFLTLIEMLCWEHSECAFVLLMSVRWITQKNYRNEKHYIHFPYLDSIVSVGIGTFVKYSHNAPVFVKCSFIPQPVIIVCSSPDGFTSLLWHWNIWKERIKSSQVTDKAEIFTWKSTASSHT